MYLPADCSPSVNMHAQAIKEDVAQEYIGRRLCSRYNFKSIPQYGTSNILRLYTMALHATDIADGREGFDAAHALKKYGIDVDRSIHADSDTAVSLHQYLRD
jgi:hypothetical protein